MKIRKKANDYEMDKISVFTKMVIIIFRSMYGLKVDSHTWASEIIQLMRDLGFTSYRAYVYV